MKVTEKGVMGNDVKNVLNKISGTFTVKLIDRLFPTDKKLSDLEDIYSALAALNEMGKIMEAVRMIRGLSGIAGEEYPYLIAVFEDQKEIQEIFLLEFLEDFYEMIDERRFICE